MASGKKRIPVPNPEPASKSQAPSSKQEPLAESAFNMLIGIASVVVMALLVIWMIQLIK